MGKCKECEERSLKDRRGEVFTSVLIGAFVVTATATILFNESVGAICGLMTFLSLMTIAEIQFNRV